MNRTAEVCLCLAATLAMACNAASRHKVLTFFFDGVPEPRPAAGAEGPPGAQAGKLPGRTVGYVEHGPYAARMCQACHEAAATNALVMPADQLCSRCHEFDLDRKVIHGPLASGGCLVCHDPHSSRYASLLVSESDTFCVHCHDQAAIASIAAHEGVGDWCTACHEAHMSDNQFLLK